MQTNIGQETRATQIGKWRDAVHAKTDLLLAFPTKPIEDEVMERFRADVANRIKDLADYLANGTCGIFLGTELKEPPTKAERDAAAAEAAARAEAEANAAAAEGIVDVASASPLALPEPRCVHFDPEKNGCGRDDIDCEEMKNCDGFCRECSAFSITTPPTETTEDGK